MSFLLRLDLRSKRILLGRGNVFVKVVTLKVCTYLHNTILLQRPYQLMLVSAKCLPTAITFLSLKNEKCKVYTKCKVLCFSLINLPQILRERSK